MDFSIGLITTGSNSSLVQKQLSTIKSCGLEEYEVIVVGGMPIEEAGVKHLPFEDERVPGWITRKKNLIAQNAQYENCVIMHDYIGLDQDWAAGFEIFGNNWNVAMTRVEDIFGRRFYDWLSWDSPVYPRYAPIPYSVKDHTSFQFISGAYWVAKTQFMLDHPLDESLTWGQSEDIEWSLRVRQNGLVFNPFSKVRHLKKHRGFKFHRSINKEDGIQIRPRPDFLNWEQI